MKEQHIKILGDCTEAVRKIRVRIVEASEPRTGSTTSVSGLPLDVKTRLLPAHLDFVLSMALQGSVVAVMLSPKLRLSSFHDTTATLQFLKRPPCISFAFTPSERELPNSERSVKSPCPGNDVLRRCTLDRHPIAPGFAKFLPTHRRKVVRTFTSAILDGNGSPPGVTGESALPSQRKTDLQVVLVSPQIPGNTGCIARTCAAAAVGLHLVEPLGFEINSSKLKRAGLDYWPYVVVKVHSNWAEFWKYFQEQEGDKRLLGFTKKGTLAHTDVKYRPGDWLMFGSETDGIPEAALKECSNHKYGGGTVRIPIDETYVRCLNLSVAAGVGIYEALRQVGYSEDMLDSSSRRLHGNEIGSIREDIFC